MPSTTSAALMALAVLCIVARGAEGPSATDRPAYYEQIQRLSKAAENGRIPDAEFEKFSRDNYKVFRGKAASYGIRIPPSFAPLQAGLPGIDLAFVDSWRAHWIVTRVMTRKFTQDTPAGQLIASLGADYEVISANPSKERGTGPNPSIQGTVRLGGISYNLHRIFREDSNIAVDFLTYSDLQWETVPDSIWDRVQFRPVLVEFLARLGLLPRGQAAANSEQALKAARIGFNDPELGKQLKAVQFEMSVDLTLYFQCVFDAKNNRLLIP